MTTRTHDESGARNTHDETLLSVVVVSWNTVDLLRQCLSSVLAACEALGRFCEVIVVDNASSDGSVAMVNREFPVVRVVENSTNRGFAAATNQGAAAGRGTYLLLLNPDTSSTQHYLRLLVDFLEQHPAAVAVGPRLIGPDGREQVSCFPLPTIGRELWRLLHLDRWYPVARYPVDRWEPRRPHAVDVIQGTCLMVRRAAFAEAGGLDERFFVYTEEVDLCRRLLDRGWQLFWIPDAVLTHHGAASTAQVASRMFVQLYRSKVQYFRKHLGVSGSLLYKLVLLVATVPRLVVPALGVALVPSRRAEWQTLLKNYSMLLKQLPAL